MPAADRAKVIVLPEFLKGRLQQARTELRSKKGKVRKALRNFKLGAGKLKSAAMLNLPLPALT